MKNILCIVLFSCLFFNSSSFAQETEKKVVVIKKVVDEKGKTSTERQEATGKEADELIKKMKEDGTLEGIDIDMEIANSSKKKCTKKTVHKEVKVEKVIKDGKEVKVYEIITEEDGEKKVMKWTGDGEMPEEMAKMLEETETKVEIKVESDGDEKMVYEIITEDGDEKKVMFWNGDGDIPKDMEKLLKDIDIKKEKSEDGKEITITIDTDNEEENIDIQENHFVEKRVRVKKHSENKVSLGIMIEDDTNGVQVSEIVDGSVAEKAGLKTGDIILKVDKTYIFNTDMLLKALSQFDKGDKSKIIYLRNGKEKSVNVKF